MKSAPECFNNAWRCEQAARDARNAADQNVLLATAQHWRTLAAVATARQGLEMQASWTPTRKRSR